MLQPLTRLNRQETRRLSRVKSEAVDPTTYTDFIARSPVSKDTSSLEILPTGIVRAVSRRKSTIVQDEGC